ncbi:NTP transferase domain-containing protein [Gordonia caeni]|uniref:Molybdopterin molybdenumtransferase n=1 Tax=Gordonia caeni TaxID=1007097 RepID=A0ABP7P3W7_9ACTN
MTVPQPRFDAIILAGGRARRLAGADKPAERVGGRRLIDIALDAVAAAGRTVVVGPDRGLPSPVLSAREEPPHAGPVAAIAAGLAALGRDDGTDVPVVVLASDLPDLTAAQVERLCRELRETGAPAVFAADGDGRAQYLLGAWSASALAAATAAAPDASVRSLLPADARFLALPGTADVDTPDDLDHARRRAAGPPAVRGLLRSVLRPLSPVVLPVDAAAGAVLAEPLTAAAAFPPFDASAMDGYAVAGPGPWTLLDAPRAAGHTDSRALDPGQAAPIATGAALPAGAQRVIRHEETELHGDRLTETSSGRDDTRRSGSAWPAGAVLAPAGLGVDAAVRSAARAARVAEITARGPVRARLHTSGDEIAADTPADAPLPYGTVPDTASGPVADLLRRAGAEVTGGGHLSDRPEVFRAALTTPDADLIVVIGATGHGVADHLRTALTAEGAQILVDGIALRPGGSVIVARMPSGAVLLGLGGNPLAAVAGTALLAPAILDGLLDRAPRAPEFLDVIDAEEVRLAARWRVLPVEPDGAGRWTVTAGRGTGHLLSAIGHRGLALLPPAEVTAAVERLI